MRPRKHRSSDNKRHHDKLNWTFASLNRDASIAVSQWQSGKQSNIFTINGVYTECILRQRQWGSAARVCVHCTVDISPFLSTLVLQAGCSPHWKLQTEEFIVDLVCKWSCLITYLITLRQLPSSNEIIYIQIRMLWLWLWKWCKAPTGWCLRFYTRIECDCNIWNVISIQERSVQNGAHAPHRTAFWCAVDAKHLWKTHS